MQLPDSYYEDEVRDGFYIPSMGKKAWAAELAVLNEVDRICTKHNIQYFAEWGTLLGAIRHGGFIPWDDDMDIAMKRADYEKFLKVAPQELPGGFEIFNLRNHDNFWYFLARVVNTSRMRFEEEHLKKYHGFPYIAGLDIFVLDNVCRDKSKEEERDKTIEYVLTVADSLDEAKLNDAARKVALDRIEKLCNVKIVNRRDNQLLKKELYSIAEKVFRKFSDEESDCITQIMPCGLYGNNLWIPKDYYKASVRVPFENTTIPVPVGYDTMLRRRYGDYMKLVRNSGGHNYPFYSAQQKSLDELMDFELPKYKYNGDVRKSTTDGYKGYKKDVKMHLDALIKACRDIENTFINDAEQCVEKLQESQHAAIELGELIEKVKGVGHPSVKCLEDYCERIYQLFLGLTEESVSQEELSERLVNLKKCMENVNESTTQNILNRKEVVFLPYKADLWNGFRSLWKQYYNMPMTDVYVVALPYYHKDYIGNFIKMRYNPKQYPAEVNVISYEEYDMELHHPDITFIQNPFDEWNTEISIPAQYYSSKIVNYTDKLVYIPSFELYEFDNDSYREYLNMDSYVKIPGVCNADEVIVQSENMRQLYIEKLVEFAGEDTRTVWEEKIKGVGLPISDFNNISQKKMKEEMLGNLGNIVKKSDGTNKKIVVYYIGLSSILEYKQQAIDKIKNVIDTFNENRADILLIIKQHSLIGAALRELAPEIYAEYTRVIELCKSADWIITADDYDDEQLAAVSDAYYGDTSKLAQEFRNYGKPVMIQKV